MSELKYTDEQYHLEWINHQYLGDYWEHSWTVVNVYGEPCRIDGITIRFDNKQNAEKYLAKLNHCNEGGLLTNLE